VLQRAVDGAFFECRRRDRDVDTAAAADGDSAVASAPRDAATHRDDAGTSATLSLSLATAARTNDALPPPPPPPPPPPRPRTAPSRDGGDGVFHFSTVSDASLVRVLCCFLRAFKLTHAAHSRCGLCSQRFVTMASQAVAPLPVPDSVATAACASTELADHVRAHIAAIDACRNEESRPGFSNHVVSVA
jgi:hypothetical protein